MVRRALNGLNRLLFFLRSKRRGRDGEIAGENGKGVVKTKKIYRERQKSKLGEAKRDFRVEFEKKIEAYKRKFSERRAWGYKYWEKKHGKDNKKKVFATVLEALESRFPPGDEFWSPAKQCLGYIPPNSSLMPETKKKTEKDVVVAYKLKSIIGLYKNPRRKNVKGAWIRKRPPANVRVTGFRVVAADDPSCCSSPTMFVSELLLEYDDDAGAYNNRKKKKIKKKRIWVREYEFVGQRKRLLSLLPFSARTGIPLTPKDRIRVVYQVREAIQKENNLNNNTTTNNMIFDDIFFSERALFALREFGLLICGYDDGKEDDISKTVVKGAETASKTPFLVKELHKPYFTVNREPIWITSGSLVKRVRELTNSLFDVTNSLTRSASFTRQRRNTTILLDLCSGSGLTCYHALHFNSSSTNHTYKYYDFGICVDKLITYTAHKKVWMDPNILFVECDVDDMEIHRIPPDAFQRIYAAPECTPHTQQRHSFYHALKRKHGKENGCKLRKWMENENLRTTRNIIDCMVYFGCAFALENPTGNKKSSLWNHGGPFYDFIEGVDFFLLDTSYCKYYDDPKNGPQKNTTFLVGGGRNRRSLSSSALASTSSPAASVTLEPPCKGKHRCAQKKYTGVHARHCRSSDYDREQSKLHPKKLIESLERQFCCKC